uniref:SNW domain-containing protein 1 n=1 Tax=Sinocyclocheilus anshuiensis TaxID=1608454 RepID=A0A671RTH7_9TELE
LSLTLKKIIFLPAPTQLSQDQLEAEERSRLQRSQSTALVSTRREPPPYGFRKSWVPRSLEDFGDGGAFPEIHVAQFPLEMGRKKKTSNALAVQVDAEGKIKYDAIARQGQSKDKVVFSKYTDMLPKEVLNEDDPELQKPDEEAVQELTEKTRSALEKQVSQKIAAAMPVRAADKQAPAQYIRYTPSQQGLAFNSGAKQRVIRMVEMQKDPMEPPRFKINKKIPRGPPSPPAPVMHSPSRKMTVKEQQEWKIPPCISNWKNAKGYTIPLDKRLAADGRGLQTVHINENFAKLAEALYIADRKAREAVEMRAQVEKKMAQKEKEKKEEKLRELAKMARDRRAGIKAHGDKGGEDTEVREREEIRHERRKERQHDRNISRAAPDKRCMHFFTLLTGTSVSSLPWASRTPVPPVRLSMTRDSSIKTRGWTVVLLVERMRCIMYMISPLEVAETWHRIFTGPVRMQIRTCMETTWTHSCRATGLFLIGSSQVLITAPAGTGLCSLRRILSVWTSSWKKPNSTEAPKGRPLVGAPRTTTMRRNAGRSETLPLSTAAGSNAPLPLLFCSCELNYETLVIWYIILFFSFFYHPLKSVFFDSKV